MTAVKAPQVGLYRDQWHRYAWNGDGPLVGVTSVLKLQDVMIGGDLAAWGGRIAAQYTIDRQEDLQGVSSEQKVAHGPQRRQRGP